MSQEEFEEFRSEVRREYSERVRNASVREKVTWRVGRRGLYLAFTGVIYVLLGITYGVGTLPSYALAQLEGPLTLIPDIHVWATLWAFCGAVAVVTAWWPPGRDGVGFSALWIFASAWGVLNIVGALVLDAPRAHVVGLVFLAQAVSVLIVSGMTDRTPMAHLAEREIRGE